MNFFNWQKKTFVYGVLTLLLLGCGGCVEPVPHEQGPPLVPIEDSRRDQLFPNPQGNVHTEVTVVGERTQMHHAVLEMSSHVEKHGTYSLSGASSEYGFNSGLEGVRVDGLSDPTRTVMLYTGSNRQLDYSFMNTFAIVAFADGTIKYVSKGDRDQAEFLRW